MVAQTVAAENVVTQITALENGYRAWRNTTIFILKSLLSDKPGKEIRDKDRALVEASLVVIFSRSHSSLAGNYSGPAGEHHGTTTGQDQQAA